MVWEVVENGIVFAGFRAGPNIMLLVVGSRFDERVLSFAFGSNRKNRERIVCGRIGFCGTVAAVSGHNLRQSFFADDKSRPIRSRLKGSHIQVFTIKYLVGIA